jgi:membrane fusion protein (multidrug efflux system)
MKKRLIMAAIAVVAFLAALSAFHFVLKPAMIKKFVSQNAPPPASVSTEVARVEMLTPRTRAIGTLVAIQGVELSSQVSGIISKIQFDSGDTVAKDAELVLLDDEVEQADLLSNKATLREAMLEFQRQDDLMGRGFAAEAKLDEARAKRDSAAATVQRIRALINQKTIKAPFAGKLGLKKVDVGQFVDAGQVLVTIQQLDPIWVDFPVPEREISTLSPGQQIDVTVDAFPGETFNGTVEMLDARVSQDTRTLTVRGRLANPDQKLLPGMFANVSVRSGEPAPVVMVPRTAVTVSLYGDSIYVVKKGEADAKASEDGKTAEPELTAERRFVRVGATEGGRIAVLEGIKEGETVITTGQLKLRPGARIKTNNEAPLIPADDRPRL